jgi:hypothetical protein
MDSGHFFEKDVSMLSDRTHLHIANFFLVWIRRDETRDKIAVATQLEVQQDIVRLVRRKGVEGRRIVNELTRWVFSGDPFVDAEVRWLPDDFARRRILRKIDEAAGKPLAENDGDISNDLTAISYPMISSTVYNWYQSAKVLIKQNQNLGKSPAETMEELKRHLQQSGDGWPLAS